MATLTVPATIPSIEEDCEQLRKAFQGPRSTLVPGIILARISLRKAAAAD
jgi:hypothetical protein